MYNGETLHKEGSRSTSCISINYIAVVIRSLGLDSFAIQFRLMGDI